MLGFSLVKQASCGEVTVHLLIEIGFRNYYSFEIKEQTLKLYTTRFDYPRRKDEKKGRKREKEWGHDRLIDWVSEIIVEDFADWLDGLHHQQLEAGVCFHSRDKAPQHQIFFLQLHGLPLLALHHFLQLGQPFLVVPVALFQFFYLHLEFLHPFDRISLHFLVGLGAFPIPADTIALLAVAPLISIEGTLVEQFGDLIGVEICLGDFVPEQQICLECSFLEEHCFRPGQSEEDGECGLYGF